MHKLNLKQAVAGTLLAALLLTGCQEHSPTPTPDPHAGMIEVLYGSDGYVWVDDQENVPLSPFTQEEFSEDGQYIRYTGNDYDTMTGIDVSEHQGEIDWQQVAQAGVEFAMIRVGYRGSTTGGLYLDPFFRQNMDGAIESGLKVGVYLFSQATTEAEAVAEAHYLLALLEDYADHISMPVVFDWEETGMDDARTKEMAGEAITDCAVAFCRVIEEAGFTPGVYFNRHMGYYSFDLARLQNCQLWFAAPGNYPDFHFAHTMWQYTFTGQIPGIDADVDLDLYFLPKEGHQAQNAEPTAEPESTQTP